MIFGEVADACSHPWLFLSFEHMEWVKCQCLYNKALSGRHQFCLGEVRGAVLWVELSNSCFHRSSSVPSCCQVLET